MEIILKDNDVYSFRYNDEEIKKRFEPYHCFDGQLLVKGNNLIDTYWGFNSTDCSKIFTLEEALKWGHLTYKCNLDEVESGSEDDIKYYEEEDIINLSTQHGCYKKFTRRKGAVRSQKKMLEAISYKIEATQRKIESEKYWLDRLEKDKIAISDGNLDVYF